MFFKVIKDFKDFKDLKVPNLPHFPLPPHAKARNMPTTIGYMTRRICFLQINIAIRDIFYKNIYICNVKYYFSATILTTKNNN